MTITMETLAPGERGTVAALALPEAAVLALTRLGLIPGTRVECLGRSPLGDPAAYRFRGTTVALRRRETRRILLTAEAIAPKQPERRKEP